MYRRMLNATVLACLLAGGTESARADEWVPPAVGSVAYPAAVSLPGQQQVPGLIAPQSAEPRNVGTSSQNFVQAPQGQWSGSGFGQSQVPNGQLSQPTAPAYSNSVRLPPAAPAVSANGAVAATWAGPPQTVSNGLVVASAPANAAQQPPGNWLPPADRIPPLPPPTVQSTQFAPPTANGIARLPMAGPGMTAGGIPAGSSPGAGQGADGTWREEGRYVIINIDGKETRLLKPASEASHGEVVRQPSEEGTVRGRLAQGPRPLANCHVVLIPIKEAAKKTYSYDEAREPLTTTTDDDGNYYFEHAPVGEYKLTWLPEGTKQWIRRLAMKPDITVHRGQAVMVREISFAQRTIN